MAFTHLLTVIIFLVALVIMGVTIMSMSYLEQSLPTRDSVDVFRQPLQMLHFGNATTSIILNIGSSVDPIMPRKRDGPCAVAIAFEPIRPHEIAPHPQLHVIPAAVTGLSGATLTKMYIYNDGGVSSSLSKASHQAGWNRNDGQVKLVPMVPLQAILLGINGQIDMIMTDMQGFDFETISSVGELFAQKNVKRLHLEVYLDDVTSYEGVKNDFCRDFLQHMNRVGYEFEGVIDQITHQIMSGYDTFEEATDTCKKQIERNGVKRPFKFGTSEGDGLWRLKSEPRIENRTEALDMYQYLKLGSHHRFSDAEYRACN